MATPETLASIVKNFNIRAFLETNEKRYLVGPKGSGKTLLLLRKAIDQRKKGGAICIPSDSDMPVDRLTATQHVGKRFNYTVSDHSESSLAWASIWKHAIFLSVLHHMRDQILVENDENFAVLQKGERWKEKLDYSRLVEERILIDRLLPSDYALSSRPFHYFTELGDRLDSSPKDTLKTIRQDNAKLEALLNKINRDIYVFMDNLDDYYEKEPDLWYNSMYGQFRAVREISLTHRHIHLFTSIRLDIYKQFSDEMQLQYYDYIAKLEYTKSELLNIFELHIKELDKDLLAKPGIQKTDPWKAFFGECIIMPNSYIGADENVKDYIHRHTLGRPRDMVHMGTVLLAKRPREGFTIESIRKAVLTAEEDISEQYLAEIAPMLDQRFHIKELIKDHVPCNIMTSDQIRKATQDYINSRTDYFEPDEASDLTRPFETLYQLGLIGIAQRDIGKKERIQHFESPGRGLSNPKSRHLPEAALYFIHPTLTHLLHRDCKSDQMIVGNELPVDLADS